MRTSAGSGLFSGGTQRAAFVIRQSTRRSRSSACSETGRDAKPWRTDPATGLGGRHGTDLTPSETVLVVEDSEPVRALVQRSLEQAGYWVLVAADAEEGSRVLASHAGPIHLLVADVVLPGRNGRELARDATAARPGLRVLYISGYPSGAVNPNGALDPSVSFLEKPFTPAAIVARVRDVLDRPVTESQA